MSKFDKFENNEINLFEVIKIIWDGKLKLFVIIAISMFFTFLSQKNNDEVKRITAITEISPLTSEEENKYIRINKMSEAVFNSSIFFKISKSQLLDLYIEILLEKSILRDLMRKSDFLDVRDYSDEKEFDKEVNKLISSLKVSLPNRVNNFTNPVIEFSHRDIEKWKRFLIILDKNINEKIKRNLQNKFKTIIAIEKENRKNTIEDISTEIDNLIIDYDRKIFDRILKLKEQSIIAKELNIARNIEIPKDLISTNEYLSTSLYYLRGYEAIDKEIELITNRSDKKAFITGLLELEVQKREIEQDKELDRSMLKFLSTPLAENNDFYAAKLKINETTFYNPKQSYENYIYALIIALIIGLFYIFILNELKSRENLKNR
jgi:hypothetical protein